MSEHFTVSYVSYIWTVVKLCVEHHQLRDELIYEYNDKLLGVDLLL